MCASRMVDGVANCAKCRSVSTSTISFLRRNIEDFGCKQNSRVRDTWRWRAHYFWHLPIAPDLVQYRSRDEQCIAFFMLRWAWAEYTSPNLLWKLWMRHGRRNTEQKCKSVATIENISKVDSPQYELKRWTHLNLNTWGGSEYVTHYRHLRPEPTSGCQRSNLFQICMGGGEWCYLPVFFLRGCPYIA